MARGSPSSRAQTCATAAALPAVGANPGRTAAARSQNRRTAAYRARASTSAGSAGGVASPAAVTGAAKPRGSRARRVRTYAEGETLA